MHMSDALVSATVGISMATVSVGAVGYSIKKMKNIELDNSKIPMMGVMGAFVFAAQMINFTIPGTGSSGHIGGGILLAALLGPFPAFLTLTSVLIIQAIFFADGGLLALGCNIFNMGFLPCFVAYPLIYRLILKKNITPRRLSIASILAVVVGLQLGAFAVVLETTVSGVTKLPFGSFLLFMQPIHLAIGIVEGVVTGAVLCFIYKARKEILIDALAIENRTGDKKSLKRIILIFAIAAVVIGGGLSYFASSNPDGLEWAIQGITGDNELVNSSNTHLEAKDLQEKTAILPDYTFDGKEQDKILGTSLSGVVGGIITLAVTITFGYVIMKAKNNKRKKAVQEN